MSETRQVSIVYNSNGIIFVFFNGFTPNILYSKSTIVSRPLPKPHMFYFYFFTALIIQSKSTQNPFPAHARCIQPSIAVLLTKHILNTRHTHSCVFTLYIYTHTITNVCCHTESADVALTAAATDHQTCARSLYIYFMCVWLRWWWSIVLRSVAWLSVHVVIARRALLIPFWWWISVSCVSGSPRCFVCNKPK